MLKALTIKQYYECFRGYFINSKTGKAKSKSSIISTFVFFGIAMSILGLCFFGLASNSAAILSTDYNWLYYSLFGITTIGLGTFASVFSTSKSLFDAKDNDLLLSMPIKVNDILLSRISLVYGLSLLYSSVAWIPICIYPFTISGFNLFTFILDILLLFVLSLFTSVLSCAVGYVVAAISRKVKNKGLITTFISLAFLGIYYYFSFRFSSIIEGVVINSSNIADKISTWFFVFYELGLAASGKIVSFIIFTIICFALAFACYYILHKSFTKIATHSGTESSAKKEIVYTRKRSSAKALFNKEFRRFISTPIYLLNCGLGVVFVIGFAIYALIKAKDINSIVEPLSEVFPIINDIIPLAIVMIICLVLVINAIAVPSIALEGKNLWILQSLPIDSIEILSAKRRVQEYFNSIPAVISAVLICIALKLDMFVSMMAVVNIVLFTQLSSYIAIFIGLINPNFTWTSETQPIKSNLYVILHWAICLVLLALLLGPYYFVYETMDAYDYLEITIIVQALLIIVSRKIMETWAVSKFEEL
ncbi:MAG: hypothetical protein KBT35_08295 [Firmicutes bacterium]|nr:hypothetical protein [Candidatus Colivicinus equi]